MDSLVRYPTYILRLYLLVSCPKLFGRKNGVSENLCENFSQVNRKIETEVKNSTITYQYNNIIVTFYNILLFDELHNSYVLK